QDPDELRAATREVTAAYIAAGIDPERCIIFNQSMVSAHAELAWLLGCLTPLGWLNRMTQFKEKAGKQREMAGLGLYGYPVLMAADILLYKATHDPRRIISSASMPRSPGYLGKQRWRALRPRIFRPSRRRSRRSQSRCSAGSAARCGGFWAIPAILTACSGAAPSGRRRLRCR